jgi:serine/threonine protein phosphatase 1
MGLTYVIGDLHGRFDLLMAAEERIREDRIGQPRTIIYLGDYVDRGPQSREIIEWMMGHKDNPTDSRRIFLCGNHEDMMVTCVRQPSRIKWWLGNGGNYTLISYGLKIGDAVDVNVVPNEHIEWLDKLPILIADRHRIYVHGGVDPDKSLGKQDREEMLWKLYSNDERGHGDRHVVHGHHQHPYGPMVYAGRSNFDTAAWATGRLVVGVFEDDKPGGPVDLIEIQGEPC